MNFYPLEGKIDVSEDKGRFVRFNYEKFSDSYSFHHVYHHWLLNLKR